MKKEELMINNKKIVLMEQPSQYILDLERRFPDEDMVGYCKEILKYPAEVNPSIEEIWRFRTIFKKRRWKKRSISSTRNNIFS